MAHFREGARGILITDLRKHFSLSTHVDPWLDAFETELRDRVKDHQEKKGQAKTGLVDEALYKELTGKDWPDEFNRALMIVGAIEGHGYFTTFNGNRDGAGVTAGIVGFTAKFGSLFRVLDAIDAQVREAALVACGATADETKELGELLALKNTTGDEAAAERVDRTVALMCDATAKHVTAKWTGFLRDVLKSPSGMAAQSVRAREEYFKRAQKAATDHHIESEFGRALAFSILIQGGSLSLKEPQVGGTERERRFQTAARRSSTVPVKVKANFEGRHFSLAKGLGSPNAVPIDLTAWGLTDPDATPPSQTRLLGISLSKARALAEFPVFEAAAKAAGIFDSVESVADLSGSWRSEFKFTKTKADVRSYSIALLATRDESPVSVLVLGGSKSAAASLSARGMTVGLRATRALTWWGTDLSLPFAPSMRNGLVILFCPGGIARVDSFARRVHELIRLLNDSPPLVLGWFGGPEFPGPKASSCATPFFAEIKARLAAQQTLPQLIDTNPVAVINAWGKACHAFSTDPKYAALWRRTVSKKQKDKKTGNTITTTTVVAACAAIAPDGVMWRAVETPSGDTFMERVPS
ncbi:MAG: hypothetical protein ACRD3G_05185 [Vicinamibacterales bacterium]